MNILDNFIIFKYLISQVNYFSKSKLQTLFHYYSHIM